MKGRKGVRTPFASLPDKNSQAIQLQFLRQRLELSERSLVGGNIISVFNDTIELYEKNKGIQRVSTGQLVEEFQGEYVVLPLWSEQAIDRLAKGGTLSEYFSHMELEQHGQLRAQFPDATPQDLWTMTAKPVSGKVPKENSRYGTNAMERTEILSALKIPEPQQVGALAKTRTFAESKKIPEEVTHSLLAQLSEGLGMRSSLLTAAFSVLGAIHNWLRPKLNQLQIGQAVWLARGLHGKYNGQNRSPEVDYVPVIITHHTIAERPHPYISPRDYFEAEVRRIARMTVEAWTQGGVLTTTDLAMLLHRSPTYIRRLMDTYQQRHEVLLPTTGTVLDMGSTLTHKKIAVEWSLQGRNTLDIARNIFHTPQAIDNYLRMFNKIAMLYVLGFPTNSIPWLLSCSKALVNEHISLVEKYFPDRQKLLQHLSEAGVPLQIPNTG